MDVQLKVPGTEHTRLHLPDGWPDAGTCVSLARGLSRDSGECPDCNYVPPEIFLLAMIKEAPTALGFQLWESAMELPVRDAGLPGPDPQVSPEPEPEPGPATRGLAENYERYADELAAIEAIRSQRSA